MVMETFTYFGMYLMLLLASAPFITGWFAITRGYVSFLPSGEVLRTGKILKGWYFFWYKERAEKLSIMYANEELKKLVVLLKNGYGINVKEIGESKIILGYQLDPELRFRMETDHSIRFQLVDTPTYTYWIVKEFPDYVFPEWARSMMAGCITCHASFYGSLVYWFFFCLVGKSSLQHGMYALSPDNFVLIVILTWGAFCISLSWFLTLFWKLIS